MAPHVEILIDMHLVAFTLNFLFTMSLVVTITSGFRRATNRVVVQSSGRLRTTLSDADAGSLAISIKSMGDRIRELKASSADKSEIEPLVANLKKLKADLEKVTGSSTSSSDTKPATNVKNDDFKALSDKITPRAVDYSAWYSDVISASEMIDQSPVRGCMVIRPWGMGVWDLIRSHLDRKIKDDLDAQNAYFPLFIPKSFLAKEAEHVDGFAKECAVVTHHRLCTSPSGDDLIADPEAELEEPLIVRPTSETIIWHMFGQWITSHRDLPLKINQWANVVRWEMRTRPFLRTSEFLWQEGHTAHATAAEAIEMARQSLDMYASTCEEILALPCIKGRKSPSERFAGAEDTLTIEALMQNGWALQSGTSHFLGQNFARAFNVFFQTAASTGERELVWATSWGVSTRLVGAMIMTHSDDRGLVLPPRVAPIQVIIVPITKGTGPDHDEVIARANALFALLKTKNIRAKVDGRPNVRPGAKYFEWERKGVPIRIDIGSRDLAKNMATMTIRDNVAIADLKQQICIDVTDEFAASVLTALDHQHDALLATAHQRLLDRIFVVSSYTEMKEMMVKRAPGSADESTEEDVKSQAGFYLAPWMCHAGNEAAIKEDCKATIRCYPFEHNQQPPAAGTKCFYSGKQATHMALFARAF